jgi:hypothetical protein
LRQQSRDIATFVQKLHATAVQISIPIFTPSLTSNSVYAGIDPSNPSARTPTIADLGVLINTLQQAHLAVNLRPLIDQANFPSGKWRGLLEPQSLPKWFASYRATIWPYLHLAATLHCATFTVATELQSLAKISTWKVIVAQAKTVFHGQLWWDVSLGTNTDVTPWKGTSLGIDYYPSVNLPSTASVTQIVAAMDSEPHVNVMRHDASEISLSEVSIRAQDGGFVKPWALHLTGTFDQRVQGKWFRATCAFAKQNHFRGETFFTLYFGAPLPSLVVPDPSHPIDFQPDGLAAIASCFA